MSIVRVCFDNLLKRLRLLVDWILHSSSHDTSTTRHCSDSYESRFLTCFLLFIINTSANRNRIVLLPHIMPRLSRNDLSLAVSEWASITRNDLFHCNTFKRIYKLKKNDLLSMNKPFVTRHLFDSNNLCGKMFNTI